MLPTAHITFLDRYQCINYLYSRQITRLWWIIGRKKLFIQRSMGFSDDKDPMRNDDYKNG